MIRVMIVDDMPIFREYLREAIDWALYGFEICAEAKNGQEALEMIKIYEPDIVLSDITMPFMDGLELSEILKGSYENTEVVLITGNSEFEYAKKAVRLGVADYIVKPFEKEELIVTLLNLKDNIEKAMEIELEKQDDLHQKKEQLFKNLIYADDVSAVSDKDFELLGLDINENHFFYSVVIETEVDLKSNESSEQALSWRSVVASLYNDYVHIEGKKYLFKDYEDRMVFLNVLDSKSDFDVDQDELEVLIGIIKEKLGFDVTIGIGMLYDDFKGIRKSYLEALNALNNRFIDGSNKVIFYKKISNDKGYGYYSAELNEVIINYMNQLNKDKTIEVLDQIFIEADDLNYNFEYRRMIGMGLTSLLLSYVVKTGKNIKDIFTVDFKPYSVIQSESGYKLKSCIINWYTTVIDYLSDHKESQSSLTAKQAKECIHEHYADADFSMSTLTQKLLVNQTYLRKMFKSEYNMTISEYMLKVRMDHAKKLILEDYYKLSAISELVGYKDPGYFSRSFKKYFGVSPSDYSENN